nr:hypothetical protein Q903MT_gene5043 [Picea sitchensis]
MPSHKTDFPTIFSLSAANAPFFVYLQVGKGSPTQGFFCFCVRARAFIYISRDLPTDPSFPLFLTHEER